MVRMCGKTEETEIPSPKDLSPFLLKVVIKSTKEERVHETLGKRCCFYNQKKGASYLKTQGHKKASQQTEDAKLSQVHS